MLVANITPTDLLDLVIDADETYHLVLADRIMTDDRYRAFYANRVSRGDWVILDSPTHELKGTMPDIAQWTEGVTALRPSEVVLPDLWGFVSAADTVDYAREGLDRLSRLSWSGSVMAVPHGTDWDDYHRCIRALGRINAVTTLGIFEEVEFCYGHKRREAVEAARDAMRFPSVHLLGKMEDLSDLKDDWMRNNVRGVDSGKLVVWGLAGVELYPHEDPPPYPGRPHGYFDIDARTVSRRQYECIKRNIRWWRLYSASSQDKTSLIQPVNA